MPRATTPRAMSRAALLSTVLLAVAACGDTDEGDRDRADQQSPAAGDAATTPPGGSNAARGGSSASGPVDPAVVCDTINNSFRCARAIEARALPGAAAERRGDTLVLTLSGGDMARLVDQPGEGGGVVYFSYQGHWPDRGYFVLHQQYYEGSEYLLVDDATGQRTTLPERPLRSPGGDRFAVLSFDLEAGYGPNTLQIWQLTSEGPQLEWETNPDTWGPTDGRWTGPETLEFTRACPPGGAEGTECGGRARVSRAEGGWILEANPG